MDNKKIIALLISCSCIISSTPVSAAANDPNLTPKLEQNLHISRLFGKTKYETDKVISEFYNNGKVKNVILSTGNGFADALSASVLAHDQEAPILLVDSAVDGSQDAFDYLSQHLDPTGTIYIVGGRGIIGTEFEAKLNELGFNNIVRIAGLDRYDTSYKVANSLNDLAVSTVVIASGEVFSDALSISSFAANKGWPILLSPPETLPQEMKDFLLERRPAKVYIAGGIGVISDKVKAEISSLLPSANVERLMGQTRFDTNVSIAETFAPNPSAVYLATGFDFADALAGSVVAAKNGDPIIFIDPSLPTLPKSTANYFAKFYDGNLSPDIVTLGGSGVVTDEIIKSTGDLISGTASSTSIYSIADLSAAVTQDEKYSLPTAVKARLYNSDLIDLPVHWSSKVVDTSKIGTSVYEGTVSGYDKPIKLSLTVKEPKPIAQYTTRFDPTLTNRTENIRLAVKTLDGKLLAPGEKFSFNESVGERTAQAGYKESLIIEGNTFTPGLGGGVCQVSSTLYNAVVLAHLQILERHRHTLPISYVPPGQDATVAYPTLDFRFKNSTPAYLLIRCFVEGDSLTFRLYQRAKK